MPDGDTLPRDVRIDQIGFVGELQKHHADGLKTKLKVRMLDESIERIAGDFFEGLIVLGRVGTVDPKKFYRLIKSGRITEAQFVEAVSINRAAAQKLLPEKDLDRLTDYVDAAPALRVARIKGVELSLVDALAAIKT